MLKFLIVFSIGLVGFSAIAEAGYHSRMRRMNRMKSSHSYTQPKRTYSDDTLSPSRSMFWMHSVPRNSYTDKECEKKNLKYSKTSKKCETKE